MNVFWKERFSIKMIINTQLIIKLTMTVCKEKFRIQRSAVKAIYTRLFIIYKLFHIISYFFRNLSGLFTPGYQYGVDVQPHQAPIFKKSQETRNGFPQKIQAKIFYNVIQKTWSFCSQVHFIKRSLSPKRKGKGEDFITVPVYGLICNIYQICCGPSEGFVAVRQNFRQALRGSKFHLLVG